MIETHVLDARIAPQADGQGLFLAGWHPHQQHVQLTDARQHARLQPSSAENVRLGIGLF